MPKEPRRTAACGYQAGVTTLLTPMSDDYHSGFFSSYGVRVISISKSMFSTIDKKLYWFLGDDARSVRLS